MTRVRRWAALVGFDNLMHGANNVAQEVFVRQHISDARQRQRCDMVVAALDAITARSDAAAAAAALAAGRPNTLITSRQSTFITRFLEFYGSVDRSTASGAALAAAWARLEETGLFDAFAGQFNAHTATVNRTAAARDAKRVAAHAAPQCRGCARAGCGAREPHPSAFKACAACRTVVYCGRDCQTADWPSHKAACKAARKAAEANKT